MEGSIVVWFSGRNESSQMIVDGSSTFNDLGVQLLLQARFFHATLLPKVKSNTIHTFSLGLLLVLP